METLPILPYVSSLPSDIRDALYQGEWNEYAAQAIFRALTPEAKVYILRALGGPGLGKMVWTRSDDIHENTIKILVNLGILQSGKNGFVISEAFSRGVTQALTKTSVSSDEVPTSNLKDQVDSVAARNWNAVLDFLVSSSTENIDCSDTEESRKSEKKPNKKARLSTPSPPPPVAPPKIELDHILMAILKSLNFFQEAGDTHHITSMGYEFMLKDVFEQVWIVVQQFITSASDEVKSPTLRYLFYLSFLEAGRAIQIEQLPKESRDFFSTIGLICCRPNGSSNRSSETSSWYVTSLGVHAVFRPSENKKQSNITTSANAITDMSAPKSELFGLSGMRIIVETTFKVYCYTTAAMHVKMLAQFCKIEVRLPNLVVAVITRDSVGEAFKKGISAEQLISFLIQNAHPITRTTRVNIVPDNVSDQIHLWKRETTRVKATHGKYFNLTNHLTMFRGLSKVNDEKPFMIWKHETDPCFFVSETNITQLREAKAIVEKVTNG